MAADRSNLALPSTWIERIEADFAIEEIVRSQLDILWQSFDLEYCPFYDKEGNWNERGRKSRL